MGVEVGLIKVYFIQERGCLYRGWPSATPPPPNNNCGKITTVSLDHIGFRGSVNPNFITARFVDAGNHLGLWMYREPVGTVTTPGTITASCFLLLLLLASSDDVAAVGFNRDQDPCVCPSRSPRALSRRRVAAVGGVQEGA